jgi:5-methylcytosine-specific restriction endonuclease McrA
VQVTYRQCSACTESLPATREYFYRISPTRGLRGECRPCWRRKVQARQPARRIAFEALCARYGWLCLWCLEERPLERDHVYPRSRGGLDLLGNLQPLCRSCNSRKGTKFLDFRPEWRAFTFRQFPSLHPATWGQ